MDFLPIAGGAAVLALVFAFVKYGSIMKRDAGDAKMQEISKQIQDGAAAFLKAEYKWLAVFVVIVGAAIFMSDAEQGLGQKTAIAFVTALTSAAVGDASRSLRAPPPRPSPATSACTPPPARRSAPPRRPARASRRAWMCPSARAL